MWPTTCLVVFAALVCSHATSKLPITAPGAAGDSCRVRRDEDDIGLLQVAHEVRSSQIADWLPFPTCRKEGDDCKHRGRDECCQGLQCEQRGRKRMCVKLCLQEGATCHQNGGASGCCNGLECKKRPFGLESKCAIIHQCRQEGHDCDDHGGDECCHGLQCDRRGSKRICVKPCLQEGATCHQNGGASGCCDGLECKKQPFGSESKCATMPHCLQEGHDCDDHGGHECCRGLQCGRRGWKRICVKPCLQVGATCHQNGGASGCCDGLECKKQPFGSESKCATMPHCLQEGHDCDDHGRDECCHGLQCDLRGWKKICVKQCLQVGATCHQNGGASGCCDGLECKKQPFGSESKCATMPQCLQEGHDCDDHGGDECCHGLQCDRRGWKKTCVQQCLQVGATCHQSGVASGCCDGLECMKQPFAREGKCATIPPCRQEGFMCQEHGDNQCCGGLQCKREPFAWQSTCVSSSLWPTMP